MWRSILKDTDVFDRLKKLTKDTASTWEQVPGAAPYEVSEVMGRAMIDWMVDLTNALHTWIEKGENMTEGELILARINIGILVECWLRFFYSVYKTDYLKDTRKLPRKSPDKNATFQELQEFSTGVLWDNNEDSMYKWINRVRESRNAVHAFLYHDIGSNNQFLDDIEELYKFVDNIVMTLPPLEDVLAEKWESEHYH